MDDHKMHHKIHFEQLNCMNIQIIFVSVKNNKKGKLLIAFKYIPTTLENYTNENVYCS